MEKEKAIEEICEHTNEFQNALLSALDVLEDESEKCVFSEKPASGLDKLRIEI